MPRRADTITVPTMPTSRLTANERSVPINVISRTRTGMAYQRGGRAVGGMILSYHHPLKSSWLSLDLDSKKYRSISVKSMESMGCMPRIYLNLAKILLVKDLLAKYQIQMT